MKTTRKSAAHPSRILHGIDSSILSNTFLVLFFLLSCALVMASPTPHHGWALNLARTRNAAPMPAAGREDALTVTLSRDGRSFFGSVGVRNEELADLVKERLHGEREKRVFFRVDARAKYYDVAQVLDVLRAAGARQITFLTDQIRGQNSL